MKAIILAGGFATRLWPLTENEAKPLLLLQNVPLIKHIIDNIPVNIDIIISTNKVFEEKFIVLKKSLKRKNIEIFIEDSANEKTKKGALGAVSLIIKTKNIKESCLILAGDNYFACDFSDLIKKYNQKNPLIAVYDIKEKKYAKQFGVIVSKNKKTVDLFQEKPENPLSTLVSTGAFILPTTVFPFLLEYAIHNNDDLGGIFEYLHQKNIDINIYTFTEPWFDIGSFQGYLEAHKQIQKDSILKHESAEIKNSKLLGAVSIASNCEIKDSILENVIVFPGTKIEKSELRNCIIDQNSRILGLDISYQIIRANSFLKNFC